MRQSMIPELLSRTNTKMTADENLNFSAKDIKYIIVKTEREIPEFVDFIENDLEDQFTSSERKLLVSKLISVEQIKDDL